MRFKLPFVFTSLLLVVRPSHSADAQSLASLFSSVKQSVVVITAEQSNLVESRDRGEVVTETGLGSGVLISENGDILTAAHVVQTADKINVRYSDGTVVPAQVIASHADVDVALIKAESVPEGTTNARLANSDSVKVGDGVFVIGAPYGLAYTLTSGLISARHQPKKSYSAFVEAELFQTDAAINQGNSGGPMFNMEGEVIGIVSYILSKSGGFEGLGFAVTSNLARQLMFEKRSFWSGMETVRISGSTVRLLNVPQEAAFLVTKVAANSPADRLGLIGGSVKAEIDGEGILLGGDIILSVHGIPTSEDDARGRIREATMALKKGDDFKMVIWREGKTKELSLTRED